MDDTQIKALIQQEIHKTSQANRFNVSNIPRHIHNGADSPYALQPVLTYSGLVSSNGTPILLPSGWTVTYSAPAEYQITHNLGTLAYSVVAISQNLNQLVTLTLEQFKNSFVVTAFLTNAQSLTAQASTFSFLLTNVANKNASVPNYFGTSLQ